MRDKCPEHVEIIKSDEESYILRCIRPLNPFTTTADWKDYANTKTDYTKPKPDIVLMRENDTISEFIQSELAKSRWRSGNPNSNHPFLIPSLTKPNGYDICVRDGEERITLMRALAEWASESGSTEESAIHIASAIHIGGEGWMGGCEPDYEGLATPWQPATLMIFSNDAMDVVNGIIQKRNNDAAKRLYGRWVENYELFEAN